MNIENYEPYIIMFIILAIGVGTLIYTLMPKEKHHTHEDDALICVAKSNPQIQCPHGDCLTDDPLYPGPGCMI